MKEIRKSGAKKVRRKKVKRRTLTRITAQKKGVQGWVASHSLAVFKPGSDQQTNIEMITKFLVDHSVNEKYLITDQYLFILRQTLKQYYYRQSQQIKSFYLPLILFVSSFMLNRSAAVRISLKSYGLLFICLLYCKAKRVDSFRAFNLRLFTEQYYDYNLRWKHFQVLIKAGYLVKTSSHVYKLTSLAYSLQIELTEQLNYFYEEQIESINSAFASIK